MSNPCVWARVTTNPGTSAAAYHVFMEHMLNKFDTIGNPALCQTLIHNLISHHAHEVFKTICELRHHVICCPLYHLQDETINYVIYQVCVILVRHWSDVEDLETIKAIVVVEEIMYNDMKSLMENIFNDCGYIWN